MPRYCISLACVLIVFLCSACTVNPVTGESEFSLISPQQEVAIGEQNYLPSQQSQGGQYRVDPQLTSYVKEVGIALARQSDRPNLPYDFVVLNNDVPNAWALPGGKIAINRGLLRHLEDEAQLAAVLGHEVVHAAARHSAQQMTQSSLLGVGVAVVGGLSAESQLGGLVTQGASVGAAAWQSRYGREAEFEADDYGMTYMSKLGYDPQAAVELQQTFVRLSNGKQPDFISGLFASHPPSQARVSQNQRHAEKLTGNSRNRDRYQQAIAQIKKDVPAYEEHQKAITAAKNGNLDEALSLTNKAIQLQSKENHFWETKAQIEALQKNFAAAEKSYSQAINLYPQYFRPYIGRAAVYNSRENFSSAEKDLLTSQQYLPTQIASYMLGQVSLKLGKTTQAVESFKAAASGGGEVGQAASQELQKLGVQ